MGAAFLEEKATASVVVAVVVTYNPDVAELGRLLDAVRGEVTSIIIVDNGSALDLSACALTSDENNVHLMQLGTNLGVAEGQNRGIEWARDRGADFVILFDQDSLPEKEMVTRLLVFAKRKMLAGEQIGAVGPTNIDGRWNKALPFVTIRLGTYQRVTCQSDQEFIEVDHIISSGALIPMDTINRVGGMRSELFIDYIDIEWCLRAKASNFRIYGLRDARMLHSLGNSIVSIWNMKLSMHSPERDYYLFRNAVWMMRQVWIARSWKLAESKRLIMRFMLYALFGKHRLKQLQLMIRGLRDGSKGVEGQIQRTSS